MNGSALQRWLAFLGHRAPQVDPRPRIEALVEPLAEENTFLRQQPLQKTAPVELEQPCRHVAAILRGDAAVVGGKGGCVGGEDRHVAIEEQGRIAVHVGWREGAMARGEVDRDLKSTRLNS